MWNEILQTKFGIIKFVITMFVSESKSTTSDSGSDEFVSMLSNSDENEIDSDSDPSWQPSAVVFILSS